MIVLDEQLLGYGLDVGIRRWYRGSVTDITRLSPGTIIKDDAIPMLLRKARQPLFVTLNVVDFWRRLRPDRGFSIVCIALPHSRAGELPALLRRLFALEPFKTRSRRMGTIARVGRHGVRYYTIKSPQVQRINWT